MGSINTDLKALSASYSTGLKPSDVIQRLYPLLAAETGMFITLLSLEDLLVRCRSGANTLQMCLTHQHTLQLRHWPHCRSITGCV